jgi:hypothetical protein
MSPLVHPWVSILLPLPLLAALGLLVHRVFRGTWRALDEEALRLRTALAAEGRADLRPLVAPVLGLAVIGLQEYAGKRPFFDAAVRPALAAFEAAHPGGPVDLATWGDLYGHAWWGLWRVGGYLLPILVWPWLFPGESRRDCGLRLAGFGRHVWIYALALAAVLPLLAVVRALPDFGATYPFYRGAGRSWADFALWEVVYAAQFFALEAFFRGWWMHATRSLGAASILATVVPYTMIHFGKPWLEVNGAIVAGAVLGSISARTRSIWAGFLVHATVGLVMDVLALQHRGALPVRLLPGGPPTAAFAGWDLLVGALWALALAVLAREGWRFLRGRAAPSGAAR